MDEEMTTGPAGDDGARLDHAAVAMAEEDRPDAEIAAGQDWPASSGEGDAGEGFEGDGPFDGDEATEEVEYEGRRYELPRPLKDALLRQADYTRKTMELADQRLALAADRAGLEQVEAMTVEEFHAIARLQDIETELAELARHDWSTIDPDHPDLAELRAAVADLAEEGEALRGRLTEYQQYKTAREQQEMARTRAETDAAMAREVQGWSPARRQQLESFAVALGIPESSLGHASAAEMRILNLAFLGARQLERQRAANRGAVRPAAEIGTSAGAGPSDPARMSMAQYRAWRAKQK